MWLFSQVSVTPNIGIFLPLQFNMFSEMKGIFHLLLDLESGEMDCEFRKRIEEYSATTGDCVDSSGEVDEVGADLAGLDTEGVEKGLVVVLGDSTELDGMICSPEDE